jgi:alpha-glucosidase
MADFGIRRQRTNCNIDPLLCGSLDDFDRLVAVSARGHQNKHSFSISERANHTCPSRHPWFLESRASRSTSERDWYICARRQADGFAGAEQLAVAISRSDLLLLAREARTGTYYSCTVFCPSSPNTPLRNPDVRAREYYVLRFCSDRSDDDGFFRVDVIWLLIQACRLRDNPPEPELPADREAGIQYASAVHSAVQPKTHKEVSAEMALSSRSS